MRVTGCRGCACDYVADRLGEALSVGPTFHHEGRQSIRGIESYILPTSEGVRYVETALAQQPCKSLTVLLGGDDNGCIACAERGADEATELFQEKGVVVVEMNAVLVGIMVGPARRGSAGSCRIAHPNVDTHFDASLLRERSFLCELKHASGIGYRHYTVVVCITLFSDGFQPVTSKEALASKARVK